MGASKPHQEPREPALNEFIDLEAYDVVAGETYRNLLEQVETLLANEKDWSNQARRHCEQIAGLKEQLEATRKTLRDVPYAITMALQWTVVPSDVPEKQHTALGEHRKMLAGVHDAARAALDASSPASRPNDG